MNAAAGWAALKGQEHHVLKKVRTALISLVAMMGIGIGGLAGNEGTASAASGVSFCFGWADTGAAYANYPVYLEAWQGGQWVVIRNGHTNAQGCGLFRDTPTNVHLLVQASLVAGGRRFDGYTPNYSSLGSGGAQLGTGWVYLTW